MPQAWLKTFSDTNPAIEICLCFFLNNFLSRYVHMDRWLSTPKLGNSVVMMSLAILDQLTILPPLKNILKVKCLFENGTAIQMTHPANTYYTSSLFLQLTFFCGRKRTQWGFVRITWLMGISPSEIIGGCVDLSSDKSLVNRKHQISGPCQKSLLDGSCDWAATTQHQGFATKDQGDWFAPQAVQEILGVGPFHGKDMALVEHEGYIVLEPW